MKPKQKIGSQIIDQLSEGKEKSDQTELKSWLHKSKENQDTFKNYKKIWKAVNFLSSTSAFNTEKAWFVVDDSVRQYDLRKRRVQNTMFAMVGMAASILLVLGLAFYTGQFSSEKNNIRFATEYGSRSELTLPDGSHVKLNSGTTINYRFNRITKTREVDFAGEAFFDVAKSEQPFVIHTREGMDLKVLGTRFNITAYPEDMFIETTLVEGSVKLENSAGDQLLMLSGQIASYHKQSEELNYKSGNPMHQIGWLNHKIHLDNTSLSETAIKLERQFDVQISMNPQYLGEDIHYTGVLEERTILEVLKALSDLSDIDFKIKGKQILITKK